MKRNAGDRSLVISGSISHIYLFNFGGDRNRSHVSEYFFFYFGLIDSIEPKSWNATQENKNEINFGQILEIELDPI